MSTVSGVSLVTSMTQLMAEFISQSAARRDHCVSSGGRPRNWQDTACSHNIIQQDAVKDGRLHSQGCHIKILTTQRRLT